MSPNPVSFIHHLRAEGYHSRSNKHSNAFAQAIVDDLVANCPRIRAKAAAGELVYDVNRTLMAGTAEWNVDLVFGAPGLGAMPPESGQVIRRTAPATVEIAIEIKSVMTEHRKAVKNRKRDLEAHHEHVHNYNQQAIAGGVLMVNAAPQFQSPLRPQLTIHHNVERLVEHCIAELRSVSVRGGTKGYGLEACCAIVLCIDNVNHAETCYIARPPAPAVGDPLHYDAFIRTICDHYTRRF